MDTNEHAEAAEAKSACQTFEDIITAYETALLRYVTRLINNAFIAQDIVQETFMKMLRVWDNKARTNGNLRPWLYRVAHNTAIDHIRRETRLRRLHECEAAERQSLSDGGVNSGDYNQKVEMAMAALRRLDTDEQQIVLLRIQEGLTYREISLITGRTEGNVGCILHNALKKIATKLKKAGCAGTRGVS